MFLALSTVWACFGDFFATWAGTFTKTWKESSRRFRIHLLCALLLSLAAQYCSTGTLSPYANLLDDYLIADEKCHYLYNGDYWFFGAIYQMLDGKDHHVWEHSVVLRRVLYNALSFPIMKILGHDIGGVLFNALLTALILIAFAVFLRGRVGEGGAVAGLWLLATFPGITYFSGQPFLYAIIVPGSACLFMLLSKLDKEETAGGLLAITLCMSILCLGYDFFPIFAPAVAIILVVRKRYLSIVPIIIGMMLLSAIWIAIMKAVWNVPLENQNTAVFGHILRSYLNPAAYDGAWLRHCAEFPANLLFNYLFSAFLFVPMLFTTLFVLQLAWNKKSALEFPVTALIIATAGIFALNNLAPDYGWTWQLRGTGFARIYEPLFIGLIYSVSKWYDLTCSSQNIRVFRTWLLRIAVVTAVLGNSLIQFGPVLGDPGKISSGVYWRFYKHGKPENMKMNLTKYGIRPYGFCR
jgi:hypothetical protein